MFSHLDVVASRTMQHAQDLHLDAEHARRVREARGHHHQPRRRWLRLTTPIRRITLGTRAPSPAL
jgi:hypothetical protein